MNLLVGTFQELVGLFVDDGALALAIVAVIIVAGISAFLIPAAPLVSGAILLFGCLGVLILNVTRAKSP